MRYFAREYKLNYHLMKKNKSISGIILLATVSCLLVSCNKEKPLNEAIIGKWNVQTEQQVFYLQNVKKFESTYFYEGDEIAYEFTGGGTIILYVDGESMGMLPYSINGNTITVGSGGSEMEWKNVSIDENVLTWTETGTDVIDEETYNVEIIFTAVSN
jgi:hypothetical protein